MSTTILAIPGQPLGPGPGAGSGTYERNGTVYSSLVGIPSHKDEWSVQSRHFSSAIPEDNAIVIGTVTRISRLAATISIQTVNDNLCDGEFQGVIRTQDVQQTNKDRVRMWNSFRPGDVVRAQVIFIGDARSYFLSTAQNDLGVIFANSASGSEMTPVSWNEMRDANGVVETRKVAGPGAPK